MFMKLQKRLSNREDGFTLIELMVVVLIIAILIAIAVPTFLGARKRAQDRAAQSSVNVILKDARAVFTDNESYVPATGTMAAQLTAAEPSLTIVDTGASPDSNTVAFHVPAADANTIYLAAYSKSGTCFWLKDTQGPVSGGAGLGTNYSKATVAAPADCNTALATLTPLVFTAAGWK